MSRARMFLLSSLMLICAGGCTARYPTATVCCDAHHEIDVLERRRPSILEDGLLKELQVHAFHAFAVATSSPNIDTDRRVTLFNFSKQPTSLLSFIASQGIELETDDAENTVIRNSVIVRRALTKYIEILGLRADLIAQNMANTNTLKDPTSQPSGPYRRQILVLSDDGDVMIEKDPSPFRLEWSPRSSLAIQAGDQAGYIRYPNVDPTQELVDLLTLAREYRAVVEIVRDLYR